MSEEKKPRKRATSPDGYMTERKKSALEKANEMGARYAQGWMRMRIAFAKKFGDDLGYSKEDIEGVYEGIRAGDFDNFNKMIDNIIARAKAGEL